MINRLALIVGIDYYECTDCLHGCVNDAYSVKSILERNGDGSVNFDCKIMVSTGTGQDVSRGDLKDAVETLFSKDTQIALFYFAGHGHIDATGGFLLGSDAKRADAGLSLTDIMTFATKSPAKNKVIILDSCHSGFAGDSPIQEDTSILKAGMTILTASGKDEYATEENGSGVFTSLLVDALSGGAANLVGEITPGGVYAHIDQSLGGWGQRPVFKTNVKEFISLRKVPPVISLEDLRLIAKYFPDAGYEFPLDPTYEPEMVGRSEGMPMPVAKNTVVFSKLQKFNRLNLLIPVGAPHMWHAAMQSKGCKLTVLGEHYRKLVVKGLI